MQKIFIALLFTLGGFAATAQPTMGTTDFGKLAQSSIIYNLPYSEDIVAAALQKKMSSYNASLKMVKGFYVYRNVVIPEISSRPVNLYFNVDKKGRKNKNEATLSMLIADDKDVFMQSANEADLFRRGKDFVNSFDSEVNSSQLNFDVTVQEKEVDKAAKKVKQLENEQDDLKKKIKKMEEQLSKNEKDLKAETENLDAQKKQLEVLKNKN